MGNLAQLVAAVLASPKYRNVCPDFIRHIGAMELARRNSLKEAIKATKNKLHQVGGAYLEGEPDYPGWLEMLCRAAREDLSPGPSPTRGGEKVSPFPAREGGRGVRSALRQACAAIMCHHASTRERLPILDRFYAATLAGLAPVRRVLDVACGLNPLTIPWMPLAEDAEYYAYDIYQDLAGFLNAYLGIVGVAGRVEARDVIQAPPADEADVALVLKTVPCLEQVDKIAGLRLLEGLNAPRLLVSFPAHSLGGRSKGMITHYEARFQELVASKSWHIEKYEFPGELAFLVKK
jgi:16S rRNA (guanine(1405)-N(7))-methyltransferase